MRPLRLLKSFGSWLVGHAMWWVRERREGRARTAATLGDSERVRLDVARRLNLIELSIRTHRPLAELERLDDGSC